MAIAPGSLRLQRLSAAVAQRWEVSAPPFPPLTSCLLTWTSEPASEDGGIPEPVAKILAATLIALGKVTFGHDRSLPTALPSKTIKVGIWGFRRVVRLLQAASPDHVLPAFSNSRHNWSQRAQWLIVEDSSVEEVDSASVALSLFGSWALPKRWPPCVRMIVQAAVDGDGAACFFKKQAVMQDFCRAIEIRAREFGYTLEGKF